MRSSEVERVFSNYSIFDSHKRTQHALRVTLIQGKKKSIHIDSPLISLSVLKPHIELTYKIYITNKNKRQKKAKRNNNNLRNINDDSDSDDDDDDEQMFKPSITINNGDKNRNCTIIIICNV